MMRAVIKQFHLSLYQPHIQLLLKLLFIAILILAWGHTYAGGEDLLKGTDENAKETIKGTGKFYIYLAEFTVAVMSLIASRKISACLYIFVIALFFGVFTHLANFS